MSKCHIVGNLMHLDLYYHMNGSILLQSYRLLTEREGKEKIRTLPLTAEQLLFINFAQVDTFRH